MTRITEETPMKERAREVYRLRKEEGLTLQQVGDILGITRERVRQIEDAYKTKYLPQDLFAKGQLPVFVMGDLKNIVPQRAWAAIRGAGLESYPIQSFIDRIDLRELLDFPNVGQNTVRDLLETLEKAGYDVSHIWATRDWQNYDPSGHSAAGPVRRNAAGLYSLPSLYAKSGGGSEGASLPEI